MPHCWLLVPCNPMSFSATVCGISKDPRGESRRGNIGHGKMQVEISPAQRGSYLGLGEGSMSRTECIKDPPTSWHLSVRCGVQSLFSLETLPEDPPLLMSDGHHFWNGSKAICCYGDPCTLQPDLSLQRRRLHAVCHLPLM